ncbi:MAG: hypothetical protein QF886_18175, partial [Planctomycetota bacterium]|nr:hypothetical protein [Planctomycetota bacterium]
MRNSSFRLLTHLCLYSLFILSSSCIAQEKKPNDRDSSNQLHTRLDVRFDEGLHANQGAANPFSASGNVELVEGRSGKAVRFANDRPAEVPWEKSAVLFDGTNVPADKGTISFHLRSPPGENCWRDGKRHWLATLVPDAGVWGFTFGEEGTALAIVKDEDDTISFRVYQLHDNRMNIELRATLDIMPPDDVPLKLDCKSYKAPDWQSIRFSWDKTKQQVSLSTGGKTVHGECQLRKSKYLCLLLGSPPLPRLNEEYGWYGDLDDLLVDDRTLSEAPKLGLDLPAPAASMARPSNTPEPAKHLKGTKYELAESFLRTHMRRVEESQKFGGWNYSVAFPSMISFLSSKVTVPWGNNYFNNQLGQNSPDTAIMVLEIYETLGEESYLEIAKRTAETLLRIQRPDGSWAQAVYFRSNGELAERYGNYAVFKDNAQAAPVRFLLYLNRFAPKKEYLEACVRTVDFMLKAQNPNGSWSIYFDRKLGHGMTYQNKQGGAHNDRATTDAMRTLLVMYYQTGELKYLTG